MVAERRYEPQRRSLLCANLRNGVSGSAGVHQFQTLAVGDTVPIIAERYPRTTEQHGRDEGYHCNQGLGPEAGRVAI